MPAHQPGSFRLETERLTMRPWAESDVDDYRALVAERGDSCPGEHFIFETRDPAYRAWREWNRAESNRITEIQGVGAGRELVFFARRPAQT